MPEAAPLVSPEVPELFRGPWLSSRQAAPREGLKPIQEANAGNHYLSAEPRHPSSLGLLLALEEGGHPRASQADKDQRNDTPQVLPSLRYRL